MLTMIAERCIRDCFPVPESILFRCRVNVGRVVLAMPPRKTNGDQ